MKGIVFTELEEMIVQAHGANLWDDALEACDLESGGAYTSVGTYEHTELLQIIVALSKQTDIPLKQLVKGYGHHLFFRFHALMPQFFERPANAFEFLESVHDYIHVEVKKLYPEAVLPQFETCRHNADSLTMIYKSRCPFADLAEGLICGCIDFYKEQIDLTYVDKNTDGQYCREFILNRLQ